MKVLHILLSYWVLVLLLCPGHGAGQFTAAPPTCPGDAFTFTCTVTGDRNGFTVWRVNGSSECTLQHGSTSPTCKPSDAFTATSRTGFGTSATSYSSTLSGTANTTLNGTLVECFGPANNVDPENRIGDSILYIIGPPSVSTLSCVELSEYVNGIVNVMVSWTLSGGDSADFYLINITTNATQTPYGGLLNITNASVAQHELTGFMAGYEYNITVHGVNCGGQEGNASEPLTIRPQVPTTPVLDVCAVYDAVNETLQIIESTWNDVNNVTVSEVCANGRDIKASYELSYTTDSGTLNTTCVVNGTECSNTCHHELRNNTADSRCYPPVSQFSDEDVTAFLTARNIVGRSNPAVSRNISDRNFCDLVVRIDTTNSIGTVVECAFFQREYTCTIDYGTDPSYTNLVYRNTSYIPSRMATISLSEELKKDTTYYYIVSAERNSLCVRVRGSFQVGCSEADLTHQNGIANLARCTDREFVNGSSICNGVVCHNGTTDGSTAVYICNDGFVLMEGDKATRVCQSDGSWNGSTPQCIPEGRNQAGGIVGSVFGGAVVGALLTVTCVVVGIFVYQRRRKQTAAREGHDDNEDDDRSHLHIAAQQGDMNKVKSLVGSGASVDKIDKQGMTPLHLAAQRGRYNLVGYLVGKGADVNIQDLNGRAALHFAASEGHEYTVKSLVEERANINAQDKAGMTPLHSAAERGRNTIVVYLIDQGAEVDIRDNNKWTPLHVAAREGYKYTAESLVEKKANINLKNKDGRTPLEMADERSHMDIVEYLNKLGGEAAGPEVEETTEERAPLLIPAGQDDVNRKSLVDTRADTNATPLHVAAQQGDVNKVKTLADTDTNAKDKNGMTPLHVAAEKGRFNIIKPLVDKGANINIEDNDGRAPLHIAVKEGYEHTVECIVDNGADINFQDKNGMTPLHVAAENGRFGLVKTLVEKGANINIQDKNGQTSLHIAAREGYEYTVQCLVMQGAVVDIKDKNGRTPMDMANKRGHVKIAEYLQEDWTPLHNAVWEGQEGKVISLVEKGADVNRRDKNGRAPLHVAAERCRCEKILGYLVERGADINIKDNKGWTPLHIAVKEGEEHTVECIVDQGADINIKDNNGWTPLHVGAERGRCEKILGYLVKHGANIDIKDNIGWTPLHIAVRKGKERTVECIVGDKADINIKGSEGMTPLHVAAERGERIRIVNYLAGQGADINIKDNNGQTPLHIAAREGHELTVNSLVSKGANINIQDNTGMTPLHVAAQRGDRISIVKYFLDQKADINIKDDNRRTPLHTAAGEGHELTVKCLVKQGADVKIKDKAEKTPQDVADDSGHMNIAEFLGGAPVLNTHPREEETQETPL